MNDWCLDVRVYRKISGPITRNRSKSLAGQNPRCSVNSDNEFFKLCIYYLYDTTRTLNMRDDTFFMAANLTKIGWRRIKEPALVSILLAGKYEEIYPPVPQDYLELFHESFLADSTPEMTKRKSLEDYRWCLCENSPKAVPGMQLIGGKKVNSFCQFHGDKSKSIRDRLEQHFLREGGSDGALDKDTLLKAFDTHYESHKNVLYQKGNYLPTNLPQKIFEDESRL